MLEIKRESNSPESTIPRISLHASPPPTYYPQSTPTTPIRDSASPLHLQLTPQKNINLSDKTNNRVISTTKHSQKDIETGWGSVNIKQEITRLMSEKEQLNVHISNQEAEIIRLTKERDSYDIVSKELQSVQFRKEICILEEKNLNERHLQINSDLKEEYHIFILEKEKEILFLKDYIRELENVALMSQEDIHSKELKYIYILNNMKISHRKEMKEIEDIYNGKLTKVQENVVSIIEYIQQNLVIEGTSALEADYGNIDNYSRIFEDMKRSLMLVNIRLTDLKDDYNKIRNEHDNLEEEFFTLKESNMDEIENLNKKYKAKINEITESGNAKVREIVYSTKENHALKEKNKDQEKQLSALTSKINEKDKLIGRHEESFRQLQTSLKEEEKRKHILNEKYTKIDEEKQTITNSIKKIKNKKLGLKKEVEVHQNELQKRIQDNTELADINKQINLKYSESITKLEHKEKSEKKSEILITKLTLQNNKYKREIKKLGLKIGELDELQKQMDIECEKIRENLRVKERKVVQLQVGLNEYSIKEEESYKEIDELRAINKDLNIQINNSSIQSNAQLNNHTEYENNLIKYQEKIDSLTQDKMELNNSKFSYISDINSLIVKLNENEQKYSNIENKYLTSDANHKKDMEEVRALRMEINLIKAKEADVQRTLKMKLDQLAKNNFNLESREINLKKIIDDLNYEKVSLGEGPVNHPLNSYHTNNLRKRLEAAEKIIMNKNKEIGDLLLKVAEFENSGEDRSLQEDMSTQRRNIQADTKEAPNIQENIHNVYNIHNKRQNSTSFHTHIHQQQTEIFPQPHPTYNTIDITTRANSIYNDNSTKYENIPREISLRDLFDYFMKYSEEVESYMSKYHRVPDEHTIITIHDKYINKIYQLSNLDQYLGLISQYMENTSKNLIKFWSEIGKEERRISVAGNKNRARENRSLNISTMSENESHNSQEINKEKRMRDISREGRDIIIKDLRNCEQELRYIYERFMETREKWKGKGISWEEGDIYVREIVEKGIRQIRRIEEKVFPGEVNINIRRNVGGSNMSSECSTPGSYQAPRNMFSGVSATSTTSTTAANIYTNRGGMSEGMRGNSRGNRVRNSFNRGERGTKTNTNTSMYPKSTYPPRGGERDLEQGTPQHTNILHKTTGIGNISWVYIAIIIILLLIFILIFILNES